MMESNGRFFEVSRRAMLAAFAALPASSLIDPGAALAQPTVGDSLPSWNDVASKKAIVTFVERVTKQGSPEFVPVAERIATFDNDGTLWAEQPMYFQLLFALHRVKFARPAAPGMGHDRALCLAAEGRCERRARRRRVGDF